MYGSYTTRFYNPFSVNVLCELMSSICLKRLPQEVPHILAPAAGLSRFIPPAACVAQDEVEVLLVAR